MFLLSLLISLFTILFFIFCFFYYKRTKKPFKILFLNPIDLKDKETIQIFLISLVPLLNILFLGILFFIEGFTFCVENSSKYALKFTTKYLK